MQVKLSDGRIATAHDIYTGKSRQITVDGETTFWPRELMQEASKEELTVTKVPAIDRLEDLLRYGKAGVKTDPDYWQLATELRAEAREELRTKYGV